jgi:hypothetical protein
MERRGHQGFGENRHLRVPFSFPIQAEFAVLLLSSTSPADWKRGGRKEAYDHRVDLEIEQGT